MINDEQIISKVLLRANNKTITEDELFDIFSHFSLEIMQYPELCEKVCKNGITIISGSNCSVEKKDVSVVENGLGISASRNLDLPKKQLNNTEIITKKENDCRHDKNKGAKKMNMSKKKKKELLLKNFEILKKNYEKNNEIYARIFTQMLAIDRKAAIDIWSVLLKENEDKLSDYFRSFSITGKFIREGESIIGRKDMEKIILETLEIKKAVFNKMSYDVSNFCGSIIRNKISNNDLVLANELLELVYSNPNNTEPWYKIMNESMPRAKDCNLSAKAFDLLEKWCDKVDDEEERAILSIRMLEYFD